MLEHIVLGIIVVIVAYIAWTCAVSRVTVLEYQRGLRYVNGRYVGLLGPGRHTLYRPRTKVTMVDVRPTAVCVQGQEVLSADGLSVRASLAVSYRIADPDTAINKVQDYGGHFYYSLQIALRELIGRSTLEELLQGREQASGVLDGLARPAAEELGLELVSVNIRDITLPGELKKAFAQVVKARQEALASLERARGETAALRNLANAARMVERNPGMLPIRMIHAIGQSTGNTYVVGLPSTTMTVPLQPGETGELPEDARLSDE